MRHLVLTSAELRLVIGGADVSGGYAIRAEVDVADKWTVALSNFKN